MDLLDILYSLSKPAFKVFLGLKDKMEYKTNRAKRQNQKMNKSQRDTYKALLNELVKANLIKIGNRGRMIPLKDGSVHVLPTEEVIINPYLIIPQNDTQEQIMDFWDKY